MTATPDPASRDTELARLAAYLLASSRSLLTEPASYGPIRLIDAARRTLALLEPDGAANPHYNTVKTRIEDSHRSKTPIDLPTLLDELCLQMAHGLKGIHTAQPQTDEHSEPA
ncbi:MULTISPECIES: DUF6092 family protein [Actinomadura]|uniref:DUF6092 family protein n=1 Tax=Actinomadura yumaensis TaxID=111807 RepID=A0ABW2CCT4_9ACTN|nr:DUF6092 family protein [Actinomadura sp. J1-007]MWK38474.1 hypothetical protein [Actinomadura sp. J1-007]